MNFPWANSPVTLKETVASFVSTSFVLTVSLLWHQHYKIVICLKHQNLPLWHHQTKLTEERLCYKVWGGRGMKRVGRRGRGVLKQKIYEIKILIFIGIQYVFNQEGSMSSCDHIGLSLFLEFFFFGNPWRKEIVCVYIYIIIIMDLTIATKLAYGLTWLKFQI